MKVDAAELKKMISDVDADGSGCIEMPEFVQMMTAKVRSRARTRSRAAGRRSWPMAHVASAWL